VSTTRLKGTRKGRKREKGVNVLTGPKKKEGKKINWHQVPSAILRRKRRKKKGRGGEERGAELPVTSMTTRGKKGSYFTTPDQVRAGE